MLPMWKYGLLRCSSRSPRRTRVARSKTASCASSCSSARRSPEAASVTLPRPARTPSGDRSWIRPSYSCLPQYSLTSGTDMSQTARSRGLVSAMPGTLPGAPVAVPLAGCAADGLSRPPLTPARHRELLRGARAGGARAERLDGEHFGARDLVRAGRDRVTDVGGLLLTGQADPQASRGYRLALRLRDVRDVGHAQPDVRGLAAGQHHDLGGRARVGRRSGADLPPVLS